MTNISASYESSAKNTLWLITILLSVAIFSLGLFLSSDDRYVFFDSYLVKNQKFVGLIKFRYLLYVLLIFNTLMWYILYRSISLWREIPRMKDDLRELIIEPFRHGGSNKSSSYIVMLFFLILFVSVYGGTLCLLYKYHDAYVVIVSGVILGVSLLVFFNILFLHVTIKKNFFYLVLLVAIIAIHLSLGFISQGGNIHMLNINLVGTNLEYVPLSDNFKKPYKWSLHNRNFTGIILEEIKFSSIHNPQCVFEFKDCDMSNSILKNSAFPHTSMINTLVKNSIMENLILKQARFIEMDFSSVKSLRAADIFNKSIYLYNCFYAEELINEIKLSPKKYCCLLVNGDKCMGKISNVNYLEFSFCD